MESQWKDVRRRATWLAAIVFASAACYGDDHGVRVETVDLAAGDYYDLMWGGTQVERFYAVARLATRSDGTREYFVDSPEHTEPCSLGAGTQPLAPLQPQNGSKYVVGAPSPARMLLFDAVDDQGFGTLSFAGVDCERIALNIPDTAPFNISSLYEPDLTRLKFAVRTRDGTLMFVDPWAEEQVTIAQQVEGVWPTRAGAWSVEGKQVVRRDLKGRELLRTGSNVSAFEPFGDIDFAYVDERGLRLSRQGKERTVSTESGCRINSFNGFLPGAIAYHSPCDEARLTVVPQTGKPIRYEANVQWYGALLGRLFFISDSETMSTLWTALPGTPEKATVVTEFPRLSLDSLWLTESGQLMLVVKEPDNTRSMLQIDIDGEEHSAALFADRVVAYQRVGRSLALVHSDGELSVRDRGITRVVHRDTGVSTDIRFVFGLNSTALIYRSRVDPETRLGRLELHFLSGEHFEIADNVRAFREVWWPERGVLYTTGGDEPGIHFASVDIPCEMVSESPWACGF